ncbi:MAG: hypothetical protein KIS94_04745 [Chitinophagales bacterium]|nr:hypothetical protein [Chitinophagales bacterium]
MKKTLFAGIVALLFITGCKQDFDLTADYKETPVVYALLNGSETVHYIRIQKGFLIDGNAYNATGIADSIYYKDSLTVRLIPFLNGNQSGQPLTFSKVLMPKDSGLFASDHNFLYKYTGSLDYNRQYKLEVVNTATGNTFGSKKNTDNTEGIKMVKDFTIGVPSYKGFKMALKTTIPAKIVWYSAQNAAMYDVKVRFPFKEFDAQTNALLRDTFIDVVMVKSKVVADATGGNSVTDDFSGILLLTALKNALTQNANVYRMFSSDKGMTFYFSAGGDELSKYINSQVSQGSGLAANEALPPYTNIENGYGLLSSRYYKQIDSVLLTNDALDTLACHAFTSGLNFRKFNGQLCQ